jgi:serine/threonine-protein kinase
MGEVYRARDARFGRDVAIKLIAPTLATDANRVHRFEQEARAAGQLNHPNILVVYDAGVHDGAPYLVSELLEGESLRSRLATGAVPAAKAIDYARQTAEGLAAAHGKAIVHRDVKPDNLFLTKDGRIKILDFGIAKLALPEEEHTRAASVPTDTAAGTVVGTVGYMSPEQVRGEAVDARSDIFSLGTVIHEMLTGRPPFRRATAAESMAAILKDEPAEPLPASVSPSLARIIARCLEKTREARFQSARDLAFGLEVLSGTHAVSGPALAASAGARSWRHHRALPWMVAGALAAGLVGMLAWNLRPAPAQAVTRLTFMLPEEQSFIGVGRRIIALSPDGSQMVYAANPGQLYLRSMSDLGAKVVPGIEGSQGGQDPVFSPDGRSIAFFSLGDQTIKIVAVTGGAARTVCPVDFLYGMSWGPDGIVFGQGSKGIFRVSPEGGTPTVLATVKDGEEAQGPQVLPDGRFVMFALATGIAPDRWDKARIVAQSLTTGERTLLFEGGSDARYVSTGHIVYALGGSLLAIPFDVRGLQVTGGPVPVVEGVRRALGAAATGAANFSISTTGSLIYVPGAVAGSLVRLVVTDRDGPLEPLKLEPGRYATPRVSPDGSRIAFGSDDGREAVVWIYDLSGATPVRRLTSGGNNRFPTWSNDGRRVAFQSDRGGNRAVYWQPADGSGTAEPLTKPAAGESHTPESWHPTADVLLYSITKGSDTSLSTLSLPDRKATPFGAVHSSNPPGAVFSPDGRWLAYASTQRGGTTIYVQPFPATAGTAHQLIARGSDVPHHPRWSPDGKVLFYDPRPAGFESVTVTTEPDFRFGNPVIEKHVLTLGPPTSRTSYDVVLRGQFAGKFVGLAQAGPAGAATATPQIQVVLNWFEELKARVPPR